MYIKKKKKKDFRKWLLENNSIEKECFVKISRSKCGRYKHK